MNTRFGRVLQATRLLGKEVKDLGISGTLFRIGWELRWKSPAGEVLERLAGAHAGDAGEACLERILFSSAREIRAAMKPLLTCRQVEELRAHAEDALRGDIRCFGRWMGAYKQPLDWGLDPVANVHWDLSSHWSKALRNGPEGSDVKRVWEAGRFPHAYYVARAATHCPELSEESSIALSSQLDDFIYHNRPWRGIHWSSGQEIAIRLIAWCFAARVFASLGTRDLVSRTWLAAQLKVAAVYIEQHIDYACKAVHNNHVLSEAFGLALAGSLLPNDPSSGRWKSLGYGILEEHVERQFYHDGSYIQHSHNYHRLALQMVVCALRQQQCDGERPSVILRAALERSLDFLLAHQNPVDGRLPNYGANDGALPLVLSSCDFADFRPILQTVSLLTRGERIYERGPWDEEAAWLLDSDALDSPMRTARRASISFGESGYHLLRGRDAENFSMFRCGTIQDRFSQIDMLHLDVWWRGMNVLVDPGSYVYNGSPEWQQHFFRTPCHNTVTVDGRDQMLHYRLFKCLYWTRASLLRFEDSRDVSLCVGEHYGYVRHPGAVVHRRSVLFLKDDTWVVIDLIEGKGKHHVRLQWLGGEFAHRMDPSSFRMTLNTPQGPFSLCVYDQDARPLSANVVTGQDDPPRGWSSRYYGEKVPVPSMVIEQECELPLTLISVFGDGAPELFCHEGRYHVVGAKSAFDFRLLDGLISGIDPELSP